MASQSNHIQTIGEKREHVRELLKSFDTAMLVTRRDGAMRSCPMAIAEREDNGNLWFVTRRSSEKVADIEAEPLVHVTLQAAGKYLSISGKADVVDDREKIAALWSEAWRVWFPDGKDDPEMILVRVRSKEGEYWDSRGLKGVKYLFEAAKAWLKGETPPHDEELHERVTLGRKPTPPKAPGNHKAS